MSTIDKASSKQQFLLFNCSASTSEVTKRRMGLENDHERCVYEGHGEIQATNLSIAGETESKHENLREGIQ